MMNFLYALINTLLLAGIILLLFRKKIVSLFRERRERIEQALDAAESSDPLPEPELSAEEAPLSPEQAAASRLAELARETEKKLNRSAALGREARLELRRDMLTEVNAELVRVICRQAAASFREPDTMAAARAREPELVERILRAVSLTPGDIAYLKTHDKLYVTLRSAFPLPEELVSQVRIKTDELLQSVNGKTSLWVREDPSLLGGVSLRIGDTVYDCTVVEQIYLLSRKLHKDSVAGNEGMEDLLRDLRADILDKGRRLSVYQLGRVLTISDGICWMDGLADIMYGEVVEFINGGFGMVLDIQPGKIGCVIYGDYSGIESGSRVRRVGRIASVPVGEVLLGRVVDAMGNAIDGKGRIRTAERRPIECAAPAIMDRASVSQALHTGITAVDALVPIGRGQRELIVGDRQSGKTSLALDTIISQRGQNVICIYVAIGQKDTTVADVRNKLEQCDAMSYTTIVSAPASASAALQYIAPFSATAMGEAFMYAGRDVLIIYDDLSKNAVAYRELSLLLHRPSGREAYPGDIFYLHSRLLERSAKLAPELGGGSMTALPIIETQAGDISSYIPTNVISITDGQIFLDADLFHEGQRPAVNVGLSVSRVGSAAQSKLMKQVSASLRMRMAQYRELSGFSQFGTEVDEATQKTLDAGARMMAALRQRRLAPLTDAQQALLLFAVSGGFADIAQPDEMEAYNQYLSLFVQNRAPELYRAMETGDKLDDEQGALLKDILREYMEGGIWRSLQT